MTNEVGFGPFILTKNKEISFSLLKYVPALSCATEFSYYQKFFEGENGSIALEYLSDRSERPWRFRKGLPFTNLPHPSTVEVWGTLVLSVPTSGFSLSFQRRRNRFPPVHPYITGFLEFLFHSYRGVTPFDLVIKHYVVFNRGVSINR